jgi:hypothetical protein
MPIAEAHLPLPCTGPERWEVLPKWREEYEEENDLPVKGALVWKVWLSASALVEVVQRERTSGPRPRLKWTVYLSV